MEWNLNIEVMKVMEEMEKRCLQATNSNCQFLYWPREVFCCCVIKRSARSVLNSSVDMYGRSIDRKQEDRKYYFLVVVVVDVDVADVKSRMKNLQRRSSNWVSNSSVLTTSNSRVVSCNSYSFSSYKAVLRCSCSRS